MATDTYFASESSIEGYQCAQVFFGMTSKMLVITGKKTESESPDVYLDFVSGSMASHLHSDMITQSLK